MRGIEKIQKGDNALMQPLRFRDWAALRYWLVWGYEGPVPAQALEGVYTNRDISCWLIRRGKVELTTAGETVTARKGQWVFVAVPKRRQVFSKDAEILSLHVHFSWPGNEPVIRQRKNVVLDAAGHPQLERTAVPLVRMVRRHFPATTAFLPDERCSLPFFLQAQNQLPQWLSAYLTAQATLGVFPRRLEWDDDRLLEVFAELDGRSLGQKFSEGELVRRSGLGRSQLNALFVRAAGLTPRRYFERRRLEAASRLLEHTGMGIKEVAADLGFRHESHFSQWFKTHLGAAPSRWKAALQRKDRR